MKKVKKFRAFCVDSIHTDADSGQNLILRGRRVWAEKNSSTHILVEGLSDEEAKQNLAKQRKRNNLFFGNLTKVSEDADIVIVPEVVYEDSGGDVIKRVKVIR